VSGDARDERLARTGVALDPVHALRKTGDLERAGHGRLQEEKDFFALLQEYGVSIQADQVLTGGWFHSQCRMIGASFGPAA
jgi:hypothetical protein